VLETYGYRILSTLGRGTYGLVHLATSEKHRGNQVAIKIVSKRDVKADHLDKFLPREIDIIHRLKHPNLVVFLEVIATTYPAY